MGESAFFTQTLIKRIPGRAIALDRRTILPIPVLVFGARGIVHIVCSIVFSKGSEPFM